MKKIYHLCFLTLVSACSQAPDRRFASVPPLGQELIPPEEERATKEILELVARGYSQPRPPKGPTGRIIHHKEHGCVHGELEVLESAPQNLRHGVFSETRKFPTWLRLSNGSGERRHDSVPDGRGLAIKLLTVEGPKLAEEVHTQDFLLQSAPNFFARDVVDYVKFMKQATAPGLKGVAEFVRDLNLANAADRESLKILAASADVPKSPLTATYFSALPQRLGPHAAKFKAIPCPGWAKLDASLGARAKKDFLKDVMGTYLRSRDACIELQVQVQTDPELMPVENARVVWSPDLSPFVPLARIVIPKQNFRTEKRKEFCEHLTFNPWHSIEAHRPLGGLNRVRKVVYERSQGHRHKLNNQRSAEPVPGETHE